MQKLNVLGISGSLKSTSSNTRLLRAIAALCEKDLNLNLFDRLGEFPHFNPDNEAGNQAVLDFKAAIAQSDAVIICTPEYAFGLPGVLKNALDWTVHTGDLNEKPLLAFSCSPLYDGAKRAMASLLLTLSALNAKMGDHSSLCIGDVYKKLDAANQLSDPALQTELSSMLNGFINELRAAKTSL